MELLREVISKSDIPIRLYKYANEERYMISAKGELYKERSLDVAESRFIDLRLMMDGCISYNEFLRRKVKLAPDTGFDIQLSEINPALKPHNKLMVKWLVGGGKRACFAAFGLHKTVCQLETLRLILERTGGRGLIICPLGVRQEFVSDSQKILGWAVVPKFIRRIEEAGETGIYLTNYETVRDGKLDPNLFECVSLDEASILRGLGGSKTFREFMRLFTGDAGPKGDRRGKERVKYRFVNTATPTPNDYIEILAYADFLGIMDVAGAKTRFFKRDSTKADKLTIHKHKEEEFWLWVASWALFVQKPSDITNDPSDDIGYDMPPLDIRWHELPSDHSNAGHEKNGQYRLLKDLSLGLAGNAKEKRDTIPERINKMLELREEDISAHRIIWHDLEDERYAIQKALAECYTVFGKQDLEDREEIVRRFSYGEISELAGKPCMLGSGTNLQRFCSWAIYLGIGHKFNDFLQSIYRLLRFLQTKRVRIDLIYTEAERAVRKNLERKWSQHNQLVKKMTDIVKQFGLSHVAMAQVLTRAIGVDRIEVSGNKFRMIQNDAISESRILKTNSVGLVLTSWPFVNQYEYSPNYADLGHSMNSVEFFEQQDYLTPEIFRSMIPGRIAAIHVKDRIIPGGLTGLGFQTVYPFHVDALLHMRRHGFEYIGMKTIVTDVVRENSQTYRLGWTEQCKDGSKMGVGMPEYLLLFRKPPSDTSNAYADIPVLKDKKYWNKSIGEVIGEALSDDNETMVPVHSGDWVNRKGYSRSRWQIDAHGFTRSSGDRLINPDELKELNHKQIFRIFRDYSLNEIYDFEQHVMIGEHLEASGKLPTTFMLLQPQSWSEDVWTDITRMLTLNGSQWSHGKEMHLCPMQIDLARRVIKQMSNPGDIVLDYFAGLGTVPKIAVEEDRFGVGFELNHQYFLDAAGYCKAAEKNVQTPTLFDIAFDEKRSDSPGPVKLVLKS